MSHKRVYARLRRALAICGAPDFASLIRATSYELAPCKQQGKIQAGAQIIPYLRALFEAAAANNRSITGQEQEKGGRVIHFLRADSAARANKARSRIARAVMRSFGEYAFLEDSRYASQQKSTRLA
jgi:hypothetical protein